MLMMSRMRTALNVYESVRAYRQAHANLSADALTKWYGQNGKLVKFMEFLWSMDNPDGFDS